jgi:hypothetical protein
MALHLLHVSLSLFGSLASSPLSRSPTSLFPWREGCPPSLSPNPHRNQSHRLLALAPVTSLLIDACPALCCLCHPYAVPLSCLDPWLSRPNPRKKWVFTPHKSTSWPPFPHICFCLHLMCWKIRIPKTNFVLVRFIYWEGLKAGGDRRWWSSILPARALLSFGVFTVLCFPSVLVNET